MIEKDSEKEKSTLEDTGNAFGMAFGTVIINQLVENLVSTNNYILFSTTKVTLKGETKTIGFGVFGNVFLTSQLDKALNNGLFKGNDEKENNTDSDEATNVMGNGDKNNVINGNNFIIPTTIGKIISSIGQYSELEYEDPEGVWGNRYIWNFNNGLILTAQSDSFEKQHSSGDEVRAIFLNSKSKNEISVFIYGLVLNKTTISDCKKIFGQDFQSITPDYYKFFRDNIYTYLTFGSDGKLSEISQVTFDLQTAG